MSSTLLKRSAALVVGAMALLTAPAGAQAPTGTSPNAPMAFSWPAYHAGRYEDPSTVPTPASPTPAQLINELLGTPTGIFTEPNTTGYATPGDTVWTQIPSFLLGNYDLSHPPQGFGAAPSYAIANGDAHNFRPNSFNVRNIDYWLAPYAYADVLNTFTTTDDSDGSPNFTTPTGTWTHTTGDTTATNTDYHSTGVGTGGSTATWLINVINAGTYSIVAHIPTDVLTTTIKPTTDAFYTISYGTGPTVVKVRCSQAPRGTITLLSPVTLPVGTLTVTLDDSTLVNPVPMGATVYADSISILNALGTTQISDENQLLNTTNNTTVFTEAGPAAGTWLPVVLTANTQQAGSASNQSYLRAPAVNWATAAASTHTTANWQFTSTQTGLYQASVHIPDADNLAFDDPAKEYRVSDAHYVVTVTHNLVPHTAVDVKVSQTNANADTLLGSPFSVQSGDTVVITLDNNTASVLPTGAASQFYVVADTTTLTQTSGAVVDSSPVAVSAFQYPEIYNAKYYGVLAGTIATPDTTVRGNPTPFAGAGPILNNNPIASHAIRQLVYFGRNETLYANNGGVTIDDNNTTQFSSTPPWTPVSGTVAAATATNVEYKTDLVSTTGTDTATWKIPVAAAGTYSVNVHLPVAAPNATTDAHYSISYNNGTSTQTPTAIISQAGGGDVTLLASVFIAGKSTVTVTVSNHDYVTGGSPANTVVLADSASVSPPVGRFGRVYCVDGLTGSVVWRYTLPTIDIAHSSVSTDTEIHSTPAVARFNVLDPVTGTIDSNKLCVVVSDDGGRVYCLDAVGNRDGNTIDPNAATLADPTLAGPPTPTVGTTNAMWIWRPDQNHVQIINADGTQDNTDPPTKPIPTFDPAKDMFAPLAFQTASPTVYTDASGLGTIYIGNSNGVLYSLDATGTPAYDASGQDISPYLGSARLLDDNGGLSTMPTVKPNWWFSVSGSAAGGTGSAGIESAPSIDSTGSGTYRVYFGSSHELGGTSNYGRIYALDSTGPVAPTNNPQTTVPPGTKGYNTSTSAWEFPRARKIGAAGIRPALGSISGSPVVYRIPGQTTTNIYFAANTGSEIPIGGAAPPSRVTDGSSGRIWSITPAAASAAVNWAYPSANDPNDATLDSTVEPTIPIGGFVHATPAVGMVEFPSTIQYNPLSPTDYKHTDSVNTDVKGKSVPMLYVGDAGTDDAMYALDLYGANDTDRGLYRLAAPNGSSFQSSPALITNSDAASAGLPPPTGGGGNGGMVYCTAGNILYQFSATPLSNNLLSSDGVTYQPYARIGVDAIFGNCGPVSSPTLAAADVSDISTLPTSTSTNTTDWLYVGDTTTGLTKGLTPGTQNDGFDAGTFIPNPPPVDPGIDQPGAVSPNVTLHIHIFDGTAAHPTTSTNMGDENKIGQPLPVFEWGDNAYIRVSNIVPANAGDLLPERRVPDPDPNYPGLYYFTNGSPVTLQIGDVGATTTANDNGLIPAVNGAPAASPVITLPEDGFYGRSDTSLIDPLIDTGPPATKWFGAYTYAIRDGSGRLNTPGSMRRVTLARQTAEVRTVSGNQIVGTVTLQSQISNGGTDPTFGILNPLALTGFGLSALDSKTPYALGSIGPEAAVSDPITLPAEALANGNNIYSTTVPLNGYSLGGADPTNPTAGLTAAKTYPTVYRTVATATGEVNHGSTGNNGGVLQISDRSLLPNTGGALKVRMEQSPLHWNDPSGLDGVAATINPLPWETAPISYLAGANRSPDYPDIASNGVSETLLYGGGSPQTNLNNTSGLVTVSGVRFGRSGILLGVHAPKYQPANLTGPLQTPGTPVANGYHTRVRVFVDSNQNGQWDNGEAYRDVDLQSGVLADLSTSIVQNTTDIGIVPQGFGLNTDTYAGLGPFLPTGYPFITPPGKYTNFFKAVTVHNNGNVNLVNAQFDQKVYVYPAPTTNLPLPNPPNTITLLSESVDPTGGINAFDKFGITGLTSAGADRYLVRTSLDHDLVATTQNPAVANAYPGATFHKARVGDVSPTKLEVPDRSPDDYSQNFSDPYISVAVPIGTPTGTYHQTLRLFEGMDPIGYNWLVGPTYAGLAAGHVSIAPNTAGVFDGFAELNTSTVANQPKYTSVQPYSEPGTTVKVTVTEARMTGDKIYGELPMIDDAATATSGVNYLPSAYHDFFWNGGAPAGTGNLNLLWTSTRAANVTGAAVTADIYTRTLPIVANGKAFNTFVPGAAGVSWWSGLGTLGGALFDPTVAGNGLNVGMSVAQEPHIYNAANDQFSSSGLAYGFYSNLHGSGADLYCAQLTSSGGTGGAGVTLGTPSQITTNDHVTPKYGVRGLKVSSNLAGSGVAFNPPAAQSTASAITEDLWAFWFTGARGQSSIQYSATTTSGGALSAGQVWRNPATLPIPAGLTSVSEPNAILIPSNPPQIEVTYTGVSPDGNSDIYVSRYQPYHPYMADPTNSGASIPDDKKLGLLLTPSPQINEYLQPDTNNQWWQARDVAWLRPTADALGVTTVPVTVNDNTPLVAGAAPVYDRASGLLTYTGVTGVPNVFETVYVDLARGRVRFRPSLDKKSVVYATFQSQARRITTDPLADSGATSLLDEAFKPNEDGVPGSRISAARLWYIYRKTGGAGAGVNPGLYYKTQRLTVDLHDIANHPISIALDPTAAPRVTVAIAGGGATLYDATTHLVDVDWKRGRIYFPLTINGVNTDGMMVDVTFHYYDASHTLVNPPTLTAPVHWLDEDRNTDVKAPADESKSGGTDSSERAVPMHTVVNESNVTAFLDPTAYADVRGGSYNFATSTIDANGLDQPHNLWLFWSSNRNGSGDLYSSTLNPRFSADTP